MSETEAIDDAVRSIAGWCDAICVRHPELDVVGALQSIVDISIINCGNGSDEHPAQALADLFAMHRLRGSIDGVRVAIVGDLDGMRCAHSLVSLPGLRVGDLLVVGRCGAYTSSRSTTFNERPRPAEVLVDGGRATVLRRAETIDDLFARDG